MHLLLETRHRLASGTIRFQEFAASEPLRGHVACIWTGDFAAATESFVHRVLPDGCVDFIFLLDDEAPAAVVIGPMRIPRFVRSRPNRDIGVRFYPGAVRSFIGESFADLQERVVPLGTFFQAGVERLLEQLLATERLEQRVARIEHWLLSLLPRAHRLDEHVTRAIKWTYSSRGRLNVRELSRQVGLCERQLARKFPAWTGYAPKEFVRILRFQHALEAVAHTRLQNDAAIAAAHGYSDQSHMIREFHEIGGFAPGHIRRQRRECPIFSIPTPGTLRYPREP